MASNVGWILSYTNAEHIALWGHNEHVLRGASNYGDEVYRPMGHHLAETFGDEYYAVGFGFSQGSFQALYREDDTSQPALQECTVGPVHEEWPPQALHPDTESWLPVDPAEPSLSAVLATSEDDIGFVDVENAASDPALQPWLSDPHLLYSIGAVFVRGPRAVTPYCVPEEMDGLLFVTETSRAMPLDEP